MESESSATQENTQILHFVNKDEVDAPIREIATERVYQIFVRWYAAPRNEKCAMLEIPLIENKKTKYQEYKYNPTLQRFADFYGVHRTTLYHWRNRKGFREEVNRYRSEWGKARTGDVLDGLYRRCAKYGYAQDVELWLQYVEGWDKSHVQEQSTVHFAMDDIRSIIAALPPAEQFEFMKTITHAIQRAQLHQRSAEVS